MGESANLRVRFRVPRLGLNLWTTRASLPLNPVLGHLPGHGIAVQAEELGGLADAALGALRARVMKTFSNSWRASSYSTPRSSISWTSDSSWSRTAATAVRGPTGAGRPRRTCRASAHDLVWQRRHRRLLVPPDLFQVVAHELLVEARLPVARLVLGPRPEARRVGRQHFVDEHDIGRRIARADQAELELRVGDDDALRLGVRRAPAVDFERQRLQAGDEWRADEPRRPRPR